MSTSDLIGSSANFGTVIQHVKTVARADCTVLIQGETGTGKGSVARSDSRLERPPTESICSDKLRGDPAGLLESERIRT